MDVKEVYVSRKFPLGKFNMLEIGYHATIEPDEIRMTVVDKLVMEIEAYRKIYMSKHREESEVAEAVAGNADNVTILEPEVQLPNMDSNRLQKIKNSFSDKLQTMLEFTDMNEYIKVKPRQYLKEDFARVSNICRSLNSEYISDGKNTHWRIP